MSEDVMESTEVDNSESSVEVSEEPSGETYAVKVDGVDQEVSLNELRDGYQRQSDYTRKTQELASERKRLQQAEAIVQSLESDPDGTIKALGEAFGVTPEEAQREYDSWDTSDNSDKKIKDLEARIDGYDRLHKKQALTQQVDTLKTKYGDFDESELFQHALKNKIGNLEAALTHLRYGEISDKANKLEKEQERTEAKRDASVVEPTGSKQAGSSTSTIDKPSSIHEAFENAKRELAAQQ